MIITIEQDFKKVTFTWDDALQNCHMTSYGFEDEELDAIMEAKGHEGVNLDGYKCDARWS